MSLGAELLIRAIADRLGDTALLSEFGDGGPLLDAAAHPPVRLALRPVGGVVRRESLKTFSPPLDIQQRSADCNRLAKGGRLIVDAVAGDAQRLLNSAQILATDAVAALRVRGAGHANASLKLIFNSPAGDEQVYLRRDLATDELLAIAHKLERAEIDEFDALTAAMNGGVIASLRHGAAMSEAMFDPATLLDQPDAAQIAAALGDGRAVMAEDGGCALFITQLSGAPMPARLVIGGLEAGAPDPAISLSNAPEWSVRLRREKDAVQVQMLPAPKAAPLVSLFVEIDAPGSPNAQVLEVSSGIARLRGAWEVWDEAQQQLELEESW